MRKTILMLCTCFALASLGQVPCKWEVESSRAAPAQINCYRGETLHLQPTIKEYGVTLTNFTSTLYYQTNGMGTAWWTGTNGMYFTPAMDVGAASYSVYIQTVKSNGISYRANAVIRMFGAPGANPNFIMTPVPRIDFSSTAYTNAPWLLVESDPGIPTAVSNAVAQADTNAQASAATAQSRAIAFASTNKTLRLFDPSDVNRYIDGAGNKYSIVSNLWSMTFSSDFGGDTYSPAQTNYLFTAFDQTYFEGSGAFTWMGHTSYVSWWRLGVSQVQFSPSSLASTRTWSATTNALVLDPVAETGAEGHVYITYTDTTNLIATLAAQSEVVAATAGLVSTNESRNVRLNTLTVTNKITTTDGTTVIIPRTRSLVDSASITAADWENRYLYSSGGRLRLDWEGAILTAYHPVGGYSQSLDWINRALLDSDERTAMAWGDRNLQFPTAGVALDWSVDEVLTINGTVSLTGSLTLGGVTKSEWPASSSGAPAVWTNMTWGAVGTNSTYRMSWDATNGTFKIEEILP
jgi:hypothetical protein